MKTSTLLLSPLDKGTLRALTAETRETIASSTHPATSGSLFSAAELWNIHRMKKSKSLRRHLI